VYYKVYSAQWSTLDKEVDIQISRTECEVISINKKDKTANLKTLKNSKIENDVPIKYLFKR